MIGNLSEVVTAGAGGVGKKRAVSASCCAGPEALEKGSGVRVAGAARKKKAWTGGEKASLEGEGKGK